MKALKHVGRIKTTNKKVIVAYRTIPNDPTYCLVIPTESLTDLNHDALVNLVESPSGQNSYEFAEVLARTNFNDGSIMLANLHVQGKLVKVKTSDVEMVSNSSTTIGLDVLNEMIAHQRGISLSELSLLSDPARDESNNNIEQNMVNNENTTNNLSVLSDEDLAKKYRSDAELLINEATRLRNLANELSPIVEKKVNPKKKRVTTKRAKPVETNIQ